MREKEIKFNTLVSEKLNAKTQTGLLNAINLAQNRFVVEALLQNDKNIAKQELINLANISKEFSDYKNIKIHIHTPDIKSFLRHWSDKSGDDLSLFRDTIIKVKQDKKPLAGVEVGRAGLALRGLAPIFNAKEYIGFVEFIQSFESILKDLKKSSNIDVVISINKSLLSVAESLKDAPRVVSGSYVVAQNIKNANEELIKELSSMNENDIKNSFSTKKYFVSKL